MYFSVEGLDTAIIPDEVQREFEVSVLLIIARSG